MPHPPDKLRAVKPLRYAYEVYQVLYSLAINQTVPHNIHIADYADGHIPDWQLVERKDLPMETSGNGVLLTLIDPSTHTLYSPVYDAGTIWEGVPERWVAIEVFSFPEKTIAGAHYMYYPGCIPARHTFSDIRQHARVIAEQFDRIEAQQAKKKQVARNRKRKEGEIIQTSFEHVL